MENKVVPIEEMIFQDADGYEDRLTISSNYDNFDDKNQVLSNCIYVGIGKIDCIDDGIISLSLDSIKQLSDYLLEIIKYLDK